jgi:Translationally controlled tumour protein
MTADNCTNNSLFYPGANPSEEEGGDEGLDDGSEQVNNVVHSFRLQSTAFDKKSYLTYLKVRLSLIVHSPHPQTYLGEQGYMKAVKLVLQAKNPERVEAFEKNAAAFAKKIVANFKDFEFVSATLDHRQNLSNPFIVVHWRIHESRRPNCSSQLQSAFDLALVYNLLTRGYVLP